MYGGGAVSMKGGPRGGRAACSLHARDNKATSEER